MDSLVVNICKNYGPLTAEQKAALRELLKAGRIKNPCVDCPRKVICCNHCDVYQKYQQEYTRYCSILGERLVNSCLIFYPDTLDRLRAAKETVANLEQKAREEEAALKSLL